MNAAARLEAQLRFRDGGSGREAFVAGAEWADAQRELDWAQGDRIQVQVTLESPKQRALFDATRDHLVTIIHTSGQSLTVTESAAVADAILAVFRPVVSTHDALFNALDQHMPADDDYCACGIGGWGAAHLAAAVLGDPTEFGVVAADRAVEDRAEVEAKMRQTIADEVTQWGAGRHLVEDVVAGIAQSIREGRS